jgi:hypothetical protein
MFSENNLNKRNPYGGTQGYGQDGDNTLSEREKQYNTWVKRGRNVKQGQFDTPPDKTHDVKIGNVSSSWLNTIGYDNNTEEAIATFKGADGEFRYKMPYNKFLEWLSSPSKGRWLAKYSGKSNYTRMGSSGISFEDRLSGRTSKRQKPVRQAKARVKKYLAKYR